MLVTTGARSMAVALAVVRWQESESKPETFKVSRVMRLASGGWDLAESTTIGLAGLGLVIAVASEPFVRAYDGPLSILSEGPYVGKNPQSSLSIARTGAALEAVVGFRLEMPKTRTVAPRSWRRVLGISAHEREAAKEASLAFVPRFVDGLAEAMAVIGIVDHVTDAAGVAVVGLRCEAWRGTPKEWADRVGASTDTVRRR